MIDRARHGDTLQSVAVLDGDADMYIHVTKIKKWGLPSMCCSLVLNRHRLLCWRCHSDGARWTYDGHARQCLAKPCMVSHTQPPLQTFNYNYDTDPVNPLGLLGARYVSGDGLCAVSALSGVLHVVHVVHCLV